MVKENCACCGMLERAFTENFLGIYIALVSFAFAMWAGHATCYMPYDMVHSKAGAYGIFFARFGAGPFFFLIPLEILAVSYGFQTIAQSTAFGSFLPHSSGPGLLNYHKTLIPLIMTGALIIHVVGHVVVVADRHSLEDEFCWGCGGSAMNDDGTMVTPEPTMDGNNDDGGLGRRNLATTMDPHSEYWEHIFKWPFLIYLYSWDNGEAQWMYPWLTGWIIVGLFIGLYMVYLFVFKFRCMSYDTFLRFHKLQAWGGILLLSVHAIGYSWLTMWPPQQFTDPDKYWPAYVVGAIFMFGYIYLNRPVIWEYVIHGVLFGIFFIFAPWPPTKWEGYFDYALFWIPTIFTMGTINLNKMVNVFSAKNITCAVFQLEGNSSGDDYMIIFIPLDMSTLSVYKGGEWILVAAPDLHELLATWHPFTCIKVEGRGIMIHIKVQRSKAKLKGWTKQLQTEYLSFRFDQRRQTRWGSVAAFLLAEYDEAENLLEVGSQVTGIKMQGAKLPLQITGPYFSGIASDEITPDKFFIMVALGVGFTGCATLFSRLQPHQITVFLRSKGVYASYVSQYCKKQHIRIEDNPKSRGEFWQGFQNKIVEKVAEKGADEVSVVYCGSNIGVETLYGKLDELIEQKDKYKKVHVYAESFG